MENRYPPTNNNNNNGSSSNGGRGNYRDDRDRNQGGLTISDRGPAATVATWHIPQLQLHILCAGRYIHIYTYMG
jgi:hypothetical protein